MGKLDRPTYILKGVSSEKAKLISRFGIGLFKNEEEEIELNVEEVKEALKSFFEAINQELAEDWDKYINLEIEQNEGEVSINFNNLFDTIIKFVSIFSWKYFYILNNTFSRVRNSHWTISSILCFIT